MKLFQVIDELVEERGLDRDLLSAIICEGMSTAYAKKYPDLIFKVEHNKKSDELEVYVKKTIVSSVQDEDTEISLRKARGINPQAKTKDELWVPFEGRIGRIEILKAKQVIAAKIRDIEAAAIFNAFIGKKGSIMLGTIHKCEYNGMLVKIGDALAFLPKFLSIPGDKCMIGYTLRAILKDVLREPRGENQLILDRTSVEFVQKLFELEIPEVFEHLVEVKKIVRIPGYKSKVAVVSRDKNIDPVGTCIGIGGVRIKPILKELAGEKVDVIQWSDSKEELIAQALKPAVINRVDLVDDENATVWVDDEQRSVAIGKMGQNIALASRLTGVNITLAQAAPKESFVASEANKARENEFEIDSDNAE